MSSRLRSSVAALLLMSCAGCGKSTIDFEGQVTLDGKPIEGASVTLISVGESRNRPATGITDVQGKVRFTTFEPGDGALPGEYKVQISKSPKSLDEEMLNFDPNNPEDVARMQARERSAIVAYTPSSLPKIYLDAVNTPLS